ncbi:hypothetical protein AOLI_G00258940 [Acnodon oligacanthus]
MHYNYINLEGFCICQKTALNPLASQAAVAAAAAMGSIAGSQVFGNALPSLQGVTGQLVTNAQGQSGGACGGLAGRIGVTLALMGRAVRLCCHGG